MAAHSQDRAWRQALISRLENAPSRTWQWIIKDEKLPWPESAERHPNPNLSGSMFLQTSFSTRSRKRIGTVSQASSTKPFEVGTASRLHTGRKTSAAMDDSLIAVGCVTQNDEGSLQCSGIEISAPAETHESDLTRIEGGVDQVHALVMDLATYTSLSHQQPASEEFIDLDLALEAALANLQPAIRESGAHITRCSLPSVLASRVHMVQLFEKLIANAIQYTAGWSRAIDKPSLRATSAAGGESRFEMKVQASARNTPNRYSNRSPGCTARGSRVRDSVLRYAAASWNCTAAGSGRSRSRAREPVSTSRCPVFRRFPRRSVNGSR